MNDLLWSLTSIGILATIILIGVLVVWRILKDRRSGFPPADERTQRITGKAATYALYIGMYSTIALLFANLIYDTLYDSPAFEVGYALLASLLVYSLSFIGLRLYFDRKGDF
jgi:cytochrome b561